jgi:hypothetical protein
MKTILSAVVIGLFLTSCKVMAIPGQTSVTPAQCTAPKYTLTIGISPSQRTFYVGDIFTILVDPENKYGGAPTYLFQEEYLAGIFSQDTFINDPVNWGAVEVMQESSNKNFVLRAVKTGFISFHAEVSADMFIYDNSCMPITDIVTIRSDPFQITIDPSPGDGSSPTTGQIPTNTPSAQSNPSGGIADTPTAVSIAQPLGRYACEGHEYGLIAGIGQVTFDADGTFLDQAFAEPQAAVRGTWHYDSAVHQIRFSDTIDFEYAEYHASEDDVLLYLRPGITRAHAEGGNIRCHKLGE